LAITLLRHAAISKEFQGTYIGWSDVNIDETLFQKQKIVKLQEKHFDIVISSDLIRCQETVKKLNKKFTTDHRLREVKFKQHIEGKRFSDIEKLQSYNSKFLESENSWHTYICEESQEDFYSRIREFLKTLPKDKEILLCSHAGTIKAILSIFGKKTKTLNYLEYVECK